MRPDRRYTGFDHDDPALAIVYGDDALLANWVRLRMAADAAWPSLASVPRICNEDALAKLVDAGLVELHPGDRYRLPALDAERTARVDQAKRAGKVSVRGAKRAPSGTFTRRLQPTDHQRPMDKPPTDHQRPLVTQPTDHQRTTNGGPTDQTSGLVLDTPDHSGAAAAGGAAPEVRPVSGVVYDPATRKWIEQRATR